VKVREVIRLRSERDCIIELENYVKEVFERFELSPELYPNILISLTEAVNNAVRHGNLNDKRKTVKVQISRRERTLRCVISDEGPGFDYENVPDPTMPENLENEGGRGVFLMRQLADNVEFTDNGSTVEMEFIV